LTLKFLGAGKRKICYDEGYLQNTKCSCKTHFVSEWYNTYASGVWPQLERPALSAASVEIHLTGKHVETIILRTVKKCGECLCS